MAAVAGAIRGDTWRHVPGPVGVGPKHLLYRRRLTEAEATALVQEFQAGAVTMVSLAKKYRVSLASVHNIITGKAWKHLPIERKPIPKRHGRHWSRLTAEQVVLIRQRYATEAVTMRELAREHGVTEANIHRIVRRITWSDIP